MPEFAPWLTRATRATVRVPGLLSFRLGRMTLVSEFVCRYIRVLQAFPELLSTNATNTDWVPTFISISRHTAKNTANPEFSGSTVPTFCGEHLVGLLIRLFCPLRVVSLSPWAWSS